MDILLWMISQIVDGNSRILMVGTSNKSVPEMAIEDSGSDGNCYIIILACGCDCLLVGEYSVISWLLLTNCCLFLDQYFCLSLLVVAILHWGV